MADNVISYKQIKRNTQKIKIADFAIYSPQPQDSPKIAKKRSRNRDLLTF